MSISVVGVVGAGFMGSGIAECAAVVGKHVVVYEPDERPLQRSRESLEASVAKAVSRGKLASADAEQVADRVLYTTRLGDLGGADAVIEAVTEDARVKRELFARLDEELPDAQFLASNTSSIPIAELAARTSRRDRVLGLHFFSPVPVMKLVEVVTAIDTSEATVSTAEAFARDLGKHPILTRDRSGFIVNMLLVPCLMAAVRMYEEGFATREDIDEGMRLGCGHPMGPLQLLDYIGLDTTLFVCEALHAEYANADYAPPPLLRRMVAAGWLGQKSGRGFYDYAQNGRR